MEQSSGLVTTIVSLITPAVSHFVLFVGALVFYLIYRDKLRNVVVFFLKWSPDNLAGAQRHRRKHDNLFRNIHAGEHWAWYRCNLTGVGDRTAQPNLLGVLAAVLNYIPYIGPAIVISTLFVVGLLVHSTLAEALIAPLLYLLVVTVEGQFLTPVFMGRRLELNPFAVFLAVAFFAWLWGPLGAFLAVPMLMSLSVVAGHSFVDHKAELPE